MSAIHDDLLADPDDLGAYLVYADALQAAGDPRGELIAVQLALAATPGDPALRIRERELLRRHRAAWLADLAELGPRDLQVTWRHGFVHAIRIGPPLNEVSTAGIDIDRTIADVARLPAGELVRELVIGALETPSHRRACSALAAHGVPSGLRTLELRCGAAWDLADTDLGDLAPAYPRLRALHTLRIELGDIDLGPIALPELRTLELTSPQLGPAGMASLRMAELPALRRLWLALGSADPADLAWLYPGDRFAHLVELGLANSTATDELARRLAGAPITRKLAELDLSLGTLSDVGAHAILGNAKAFAHLRRLELSHAYLSDGVRAALAALGPHVVLDDPQSPDDDLRYPAIR